MPRPSFFVAPRDWCVEVRSDVGRDGARGETERKDGRERRGEERRGGATRGDAARAAMTRHDARRRRRRMRPRARRPRLRSRVLVARHRREQLVRRGQREWSLDSVGPVYTGSSQSSMSRHGTPRFEHFVVNRASRALESFNPEGPVYTGPPVLNDRPHGGGRNERSAIRGSTRGHEKRPFEGISCRNVSRWEGPASEIFHSRGSRVSDRSKMGIPCTRDPLK